MLVSLALMTLGLELLTADAAFVGSANNARDGLRLTNGRRLALGLPLLPPRRATPRQAAAGSSASMLPPAVATCNIRAAYASTGQSLGYLSPAITSFNYRTFQDTQAGALVFTFTASASASSSLNTQLTLMTTNGDPDYPVNGAVVRGVRDTATDLGPDRSATASLSPVSAPDPPSALDRRTGYGHTETAIWTYDPASHALSAQWANTDGAMPRNYIYYDSGAVESVGGFLLSGQASIEGYPTRSQVTFTCDPTT
ncbi:hypothetical protein B0H14DRAFT_3876891 [Mycena olivaceomarginata]|nr:hypothetical protein B0H14DRAFT_3876891 [Mycena olivaceomarginata]